MGRFYSDFTRVFLFFHSFTFSSFTWQLICKSVKLTKYTCIFLLAKVKGKKKKKKHSKVEKKMKKKKEEKKVKAKSIRLIDSAYTFHLCQCFFSTFTGPKFDVRGSLLHWEMHKLYWEYKKKFPSYCISFLQGFLQSQSEPTFGLYFGYSYSFTLFSLFILTFFPLEPLSKTPGAKLNKEIFLVNSSMPMYPKNCKISCKARSHFLFHSILSFFFLLLFLSCTFFFLVISLVLLLISGAFTINGPIE